MNYGEHESVSASSEAGFYSDIQGGCQSRPYKAEKHFLTSPRLGDREETYRTKQHFRSSQSTFRALPASLAMLTVALPCVLAQSASEASRDLSDIQNNDPQGFTWMLICIGIIVTAAVSLIAVTTVLAMKGKKRA